MPELQRLRPDHAPALLAFERENRAYFAASIPDRGDDYFAHFDARHRELLAAQAAGIDHFHVLVGDGGEILGRVNLIDVKDGGAEVGYRIAKKVAGQGLATAAVKEVCELAATEYGLTMLRAGTSVDNAGSRAVLARNGFLRIGETRYVRPLKTAKYLCFWGHQPQRDGSIGAGCLSQWWPVSFTVDGLTFASAEHYMMWRKAKLFGDDETAERILGAATPGEAKSLGRRVRGFDETEWEARRYEIVVAGSLAKFGRHEDLRAFLLGTGDRVLVEASPVDRIWGIGLAADDPRAEDPARWRGLNLLGFALMEARAALRAEQTSS
jgi:ribA/ribD-fused uncharacterized protein